MNDLLELLRGLTRQSPQALALDAVDVLIVAFAIYRLLVIVKGTRAMQMGVGLALVFAVHQLSRTLGLMTLYSLLDTLLASIVLIVVVVFQSDIRRALMRFGRRPFLSPFKSSQESQVVEEVIKAATQLAHDRIGGLIVFERDAALEEFIEPGTVMDAQVTKELLVSIFIPSHENPVHDGAVIIREGRIWQAGAFLPLTANPKLDRNLGTRHRAAIGISEETDAVVVVVSEERGQVSLCFNGNMVPRLDAAELRKVLLGLFSSRPRKGAAPVERERTSIPPARPMAGIFTQPDDTGPVQIGSARRDEGAPAREVAVALPDEQRETGPLRVRLDSGAVILHESSVAAGGSAGTGPAAAGPVDAEDDDEAHPAEPATAAPPAEGTERAGDRTSTPEAPGEERRSEPTAAREPAIAREPVADDGGDARVEASAPASGPRLEPATAARADATPTRGRTEGRGDATGRIDTRPDEPVPSGSPSALALADAEAAAGADEDEPREREPSGSPSASAIADAEATASADEEREP